MTNLKSKILAKFSSSMNSIKAKIYFSYAVIFLFLLVPTILIGVNSIGTTSKYNNIINNINYAKSLSSFLKSNVDIKIWDIVAEKKSFEEINPYNILQEISFKTDFLYNNASSDENKENIKVIKNTLNTLAMYVEILDMQIENKSKVSQNEKIYDVILSVSSNINDLLSDFIMVEITNASLANENLQKSQNKILILAAIILIFTILFAVFTVSSLMLSVQTPLKDLESFAFEVSKGNFKNVVKSPQLIELKGLTESLNIMSVKLEKFINDSIEYQQNLKKSELQILQAQITPHFLYNTLDTIVWLAEEKKYKEVINVTKALSDFFRISLSKGSDWISVGQEIKHAKSYLTIQKIRYRDILKYEIIEDDSIKNEKILKLLLQPLIENALYHGIKETRRGGNIKVICKKEKENLVFEVIDDGAGITNDNLLKVYNNFSKPAEKINESYGLYNVNKRLVLYYGEQYKLKIKSIIDKGTIVTFKIPIEKNEVNFFDL